MRALEVPFVVFADFECFIEKQKYQKTRVLNPKDPSTKPLINTCIRDCILHVSTRQYSRVGWNCSMLQKEDENVPQVFAEMLETDIKRLNNIPFARLIAMTAED